MVTAWVDVINIATVVLIVDARCSTTPDQRERT
jgi:hypothetical protein